MAQKSNFNQQFRIKQKKRKDSLPIIINKRSGSIKNNSLASGMSIKKFGSPNNILNATMNIPIQNKIFQEPETLHSLNLATTDQE